MSNVFVRNLDPAVRNALIRAAGARGITLAQYITKLLALHESIRTLADAGEDGLQEELDKLGLQSVTK